MQPSDPFVPMEITVRRSPEDVAVGFRTILRHTAIATVSYKISLFRIALIHCVSPTRWLPYGTFLSLTNTHEPGGVATCLDSWNGVSVESACDVFDSNDFAIRERDVGRVCFAWRSIRPPNNCCRNNGRRWAGYGSTPLMIPSRRPRMTARRSSRSSWAVESSSGPPRYEVSRGRCKVLGCRRSLGPHSERRQRQSDAEPALGRGGQRLRRETGTRRHRV